MKPTALSFACEEKEKERCDEAGSKKCLAPFHPSWKTEEEERIHNADPRSQAGTLAKFYTENTKKIKYKILYLDAKVPMPDIQHKAWKN